MARHPSSKSFFAIMICLGLLGLACHSGPLGNVEHPRLLSGLTIHCEPDDALLFIDDKYLGVVRNAEKKALPLSKGFHRIEIRREGYFAYFSEVTLASGVKQRLNVMLRKEPF